MVKRKRMTHEEHLELAQDVSNIMPTLQRVLATVGNKMGATSDAYKYLHKTVCWFDRARFVLDKQYHQVTSNEQFFEKGHIYYETRNPSNPLGK